MERMDSLFEKALNLESPCTLKRIEFNNGRGVLTIAIDFPRGSSFSCPKCGQPSKAYDCTEKQWRHLNFFQYACYLTARTPRVQCKQDGILQIDVPWARPGADFTLLFELLAMTLCREMPVNTVSSIIGEDDNKLWTMMQHYTETTRQKEDYSEVTQRHEDHQHSGRCRTED